MMEPHCEAAAEAARALFYLHASPALTPAKAADLMRAGLAAQTPAALQLDAPAHDSAEESDDTESGYGSASRDMLAIKERKNGSGSSRHAPSSGTAAPPRRPRSRRIMLRKNRDAAASYKRSVDEEDAQQEEEEAKDDESSRGEHGDDAMSVVQACDINNNNNNNNNRHGVEVDDDDDDDDDDEEEDVEFAETRSEPPGLGAGSTPNTALAALLNLNRAFMHGAYPSVAGPSSTSASAVAAAANLKANPSHHGHMDSLLQGASMLADMPAAAARRARSSSVAVVEKRFSRDAMPVMRMSKVGAYSPDERKRLIDKFLRKREKRIWRKRVKYNVRKNFADSRLRVKGRFVRKEDEEQLRELLVLSF
ncbi:Two-component response regulator-like APRR7 [Hondaea fermentalgiana]|uniref:Two-component response regulator-like APRR7 n=1 Tax=Hondaea fermentalgiana TaxID=2315210 RepID=A0A2R5GAF6_9STRA|nr:Two-component response regulator-like APRR7 [Hondaea fermentalgiana]|eukprot:GBG25061.1 Two-component response regulator-like APRR7 [Hondaea fermentalgiana]